jgi:lipopolysaccharide assembly outer membrane protein LptD (OstA)
MTACLLVAVGWASGEKPLVAPGQRIPVTVEISGDEVLYSREKQMAYARGTVEVMIRRRDKPDEWVKVTAGRADANLATGVTDASAGVRIETARGVFSGRVVHLDPTKQEFWLRNTAAVVDVKPGPRDTMARAYFAGDEIGGKPNVYYILRGRVSTCDKPNPDWAIEAREIDYDTRTGDMVVKHGRVRMYGLSLPMISPYRIALAPMKKKSKRSILPGMGINKRDGIFLPYRLRLSGPEAATGLTTDFKITSRRGIMGRADVEHPSDTNEWSIALTRREDHFLRLQHYYSADRMPELNFTRHMYPPAKMGEVERQVLDFSLTGGRYHEEPAPKLGASHSAFRLSLGVHQGFRPDCRDQLSGSWFGWEGMCNLYDTGDKYLRLLLEVGQGWRPSDRFGAGVSVRHYLKTGDTPLFLDVPDVTTEIRPAMDWQITDKWRINGDARYAFDFDRWLDYSVAVHRQVHCVTWYVSYRLTHHAIVVGMDLSGLMGETLPYPSVREPTGMGFVMGAPTSNPGEQ